MAAVCAESSTYRNNANGDGLALTHGAGSNCNAPLLVSLARAFCDSGMWCCATISRSAFSAPAARPPPPARRAIAKAWPQPRPKCANWRRAASSPADHSYGGRQTAMIAAERPGLADGLLLLSYPLHPPGKPEQLRTAYFPQWRTPALFVHGTRDPFGTIEELRAAIAAIPARVDILAVQSAGHDLKPGGAHGRGDSGPHVILRNNSQRDISMREYRYTTPHGIQVTRTSSKTSFRKGLQHLLQRPGPAPWDLSFVGIRVSREIFALGYRLHLSAARNHLLRPARRVPPAQ